ncbi:uncharacterized protein ZK1073.1-like isoform X2 [Paramacrobiotus metropolitanus]|uniref:uncharacterized protein ZK1073.1-like isoform X2 n=1 Tax=Paramacrobiotus metropolitanus TaxID=2943436 RepID=UPI0024465615|nr:uncharacterized protein ZK1073.1-like isoform X2 [Paramacrobiotus metropolitanus]
MADENLVQRVNVHTSHCGDVSVHILGDYKNISQKAVFITVHDFGANATSFDRFINHESMTEVRAKSVWINFEVPGQSPNAPDLPHDFKFPSLQEIGEDLVEVLNQLHVQYVVGFGEGAGANILTRFAMTYPTRVLGLLAIHPTATSAGFKEWVKDKMMSWKMKNANPSAEDYLVMYKFGNQMERSEVENRENMIQQYLSDIRGNTNFKNLHAYMDAFLNRNDLTNQLRERLTCDTMIVCGTKSSFQHTVVTMYSHLNPQKSSLLKIDNVADVLIEAPEQLARGLILFCKGLGLLTSVSTPAERARSLSQGMDGAPRRRMSMQEADVPRRLSTSRPPEIH